MRTVLRVKMTSHWLVIGYFGWQPISGNAPPQKEVCDISPAKTNYQFWGVYPARYLKTGLYHSGLFGLLKYQKSDGLLVLSLHFSVPGNTSIRVPGILIGYLIRVRAASWDFFFMRENPSLVHFYEVSRGWDDWSPSSR